METLRRIVVATDFSEGAARAARRGALLAKTHGIPIELLHVVSASGLQSVRAWFVDRVDLADQITADAGRLLGEASAALGGHATTQLVVGDVYQELIARSGPDVLLVMGARGETTLGDLLFGSTAEHVVRDAAGPLLVVRSEAHEPYRSILTGMDLESGCSRLLNEVVDFEPGARLIGLHAYRVPFEAGLQRAGVSAEEMTRHRSAAARAALNAVEALGEGPSFNGRSLTPVAERGDPGRLLVEVGKRMNADLIAVARRSRSVIQSLLIGSVARHVVAEADRDVLVLRGPPLA